MRVLFIGGIFAEAGRDMVKDFLPRLKSKENIDICIANCENLAGGFGLTPGTYQDVCQAGVDVATGGNHTFDKKEGIPILEDEPYALRPANYPKGTPGKGAVLYTNTKGQKLVVMNVMGRVFMDPLDCPFRKVDELLKEFDGKTKCVFLDIHAEATSEKIAMAWHLDGRASAVVGTHTHVQTADERIFPKGLGYLTDAGMTGPMESVIGIKQDIIVDRFITKRGRKFEPGTANPWLSGVIFDLDESTGKCRSVKRVRIERSNPSTHP